MTKINECRSCTGSLTEIINLGSIYQNNFVDEQSKLIKSPLSLAKCNNCGLVQLHDEFDMDSLYRQYWYKSSLNKSMIVALQDIISNIESRINLNDNDVVVDIGANDGTLLSLYSNKKLKRIAFDPALNLKEELQKNCEYMINDYFNSSTYPIEKKAKVITSIAMFYDLPDPNKFIEDIKLILDEDGIWIVQFTDLLSMLKINAFDNICHEHLEYYSFEVIKNILENHNLEIFDVSNNNVNGGSIRIYVSNKNKFKVKDSVQDMLKLEKDYLDSFINPFEAFKKRTEFIKSFVKDFIVQEKNKGKKIFVLGASTKGNTLLQYFNIDNTLIDYCAEVNKDKFGLKTVGTNIPIISEEDALKMNPDYFLILPWHFLDTFKKNFKSYLNNGGKFIVPCPEPKIIING